MTLFGNGRGDAIPVGRGVAVPEDRDLSLIGGAVRTAYAAELFDLVEVSCVLVARQRWRPRRAELRRGVERPRSHVGELWPSTGEKSGRGRPPLAHAHAAEKGGWRGAKSVGAAPQEDIVGDLLPPFNAACD